MDRANHRPQDTVCFKDFPHQAHYEQGRAVATADKGGYTERVQKIYGVPPTLPEEHHEEVDNLSTIVQEMQTHSYYMEWLAQANKFLTSPKSTVMEQLAHMTVTMNTMQDHIKKLSLKPTKTTRTNRKYYCWICRRKFTHGSKTCSAKKKIHKQDAYYKNQLGGSKNRCKWRLGVIINKIEIINPKISLINCIGNPPNYPSKKKASNHRLRCEYTPRK